MKTVAVDRADTSVGAWVGVGAVVLVAVAGIMPGFTMGALAVPMGLALSVVMIFVINKRAFGWTLDMQIGAGVLAQALALAIVAALLAGLYPAWRMARTSPAVALRSE